MGVLPADKDMCDGGPLDGPISAEGEARLAVDILGVAHIRTVVALVDGHVYPGALRMGLGGEGGG